jgi:SAM-dependent methyltransferase
MDQPAAYDRFAKAYRDWWGPVIAPSAVRLLDRVDRYLGRDEPMDFVDVGVGTGTLAIAALERWPGATGTGVDASPAMLDLAGEAARRRGAAVAARLRLVRGDAAQLPLADASVDLAVSSFVIQLLASRAPALREMHRVVRPGGLVAVVTWQAERTPFAPDDVVSDTFDELEVPETPGGGDPLPYTSPRAAAAEFRRAGFRDVQARVDWLDHQFTPQGFLDVVEHWSEEDAVLALPRSRRAELRRLLRERLDRLDAAALRWRRPLVSVVARRP